MAVKVVTIKNWHRGMSDVDIDDYSLPGQASYIQHADIIESQPFLRPNFAVESEESGLNTGANGKIGRVRAYATRYAGIDTTKIYAFDYGDDTGTPRIGVFEKDSFADTAWSDIDSFTDAQATTEPPANAVFWKGDRYAFFADHAAGANSLSIGIFDSNGGASATTTHDLINDANWGGPSSGIIKRFLNHTDGETYVLVWNATNGQGYMGVYVDASSKFNSGIPVAMPAGYEPEDFISYGNKILVLANSSRGETSTIFIRDPYQSLVYTFDDFYNIKINRVVAMRIVKGRVIIISCDFDYKIWEWTGGDNVNLLKVLPVNDYNSLFNVRPEAVDVKDGILYFGTACGVSGFNNGVYAFGFNDDGSTFLYNVMTDDENDTSNIEYRALKWYDDETSVGMFVTSLDVTNSTYNNMEYVIGASRTANLDWRSTWIRPFLQKSQLIQVDLFHEAASAGTISLYQETDAADPITWDATNLRFTALCTSSYLTRYGNNGVKRGTLNAAGTAFTGGRKHKIRVTMTSGAQLEKIKLTFRTQDRDRYGTL